MHILLVNTRVKLNCLEDFINATLENAQNSINEEGVIRFDVLQNKDDMTSFTLVEVYHESKDHAAHRETAHYKRWRDSVAEMMAEPRVATVYSNLFPDDSGWTK